MPDGTEIKKTILLVFMLLWSDSKRVFLPPIRKISDLLGKRHSSCRSSTGSMSLTVSRDAGLQHKSSEQDY
jgi:hypothetical protein